MPVPTNEMTSPIIDEVEAATAAVFSTYDGTHAAAIANCVGELLQSDDQREPVPVHVGPPGLQSRRDHWQGRSNATMNF